MVYTIFNFSLPFLLASIQCLHRYHNLVVGNIYTVRISIWRITSRYFCLREQIFVTRGNIRKGHFPTHIGNRDHIRQLNRRIITAA